MFARRDRPFWVCVLLLMGVYLPTSSGGDITKGWTRLALTVVCVVLSILLISERGRAKKDLLLIGISILLLLLFCTLFSILTVPVYGILASFAAFSLLISVRLDNIRATKLVQRTFFVANVANVLLGFGILLHAYPVQFILVNYYSSAYPELVPMMMDLGKPVLTFSTHSLAALVHYLFFWANLCAYKQTGKKTYLWFSIIYTVFMLALLSVSGVFFFCAASVQLVWIFLRQRIIVAVLSVSFLIFMFLGTAAFLASQGYFSEGIAAQVGEILSAQGNGFLGRYSFEGNLLPVLSYLSQHPFRPTGLTTDEDMVLIDSGPIGYYIRGSIVLVVLMYGGLFLFLKRNLQDRRDAYLLFVVILCFEVGFSALTSFRAICILPIIIVYLNGLRVPNPSRPSSRQILALDSV